jgi:hypothetical protein
VQQVCKRAAQRLTQRCAMLTRCAV